ncbi:MAG: LysM peptidoglycan-binding domain-containing protein, partial [Archangium sp.]
MTTMKSFPYQVSVGDTLSAIAQRYNVPVEVLARLNGLSDPNRLGAGLVLKIPHERRPMPRFLRKSVTHRVRAGETLPDIAWRYDVTVEALAQANGLEIHSRVSIGQKLEIPSGHKPTPRTQANKSQTAGTKTNRVVHSSTTSTSVVASASKTP